MEPSDIVLLALAVICPPGSVALKRGLNRDFIICTALTLLFWVPGIAYSWYLIFKYPLENFRQRGGPGRYQTIEDGLRRQSMGGALALEDDGSERSEDDHSLGGTPITPDTTAVAPHSTLRPPSRKSMSGRKKSHRGRKSGSGRRKSSSSSRSGSTGGRQSVALQEAARKYAMRQQQRERSNSVKKWFVDRFYFADPTQVPPEMGNDLHSNSESHELSVPQQ
ncbi:hypothetical protein EC988_002703 [Linderina pennispora]|nr:hypothetical protein EC988_002703 [Linderina pennispora]